MGETYARASFPWGKSYTGARYPGKILSRGRFSWGKDLGGILHYKTGKYVSFLRKSRKWINFENKKKNHSEGLNSPRRPARASSPLRMDCAVQSPIRSPSTRCYVAVCNNYAICNKLQTALNCNAVCNTSYFKLRCDGNAICNVLQIASKFYHLKILKRRKKNDKRQNASLQSYLTMNSARLQSIRARHVKLPINTTIVQNAILPPHFCEIGGGGH